MQLIYIKASAEDHTLLTETSYISKKNWGYTDELMRLWESDLQVNEEYILHNKVVKVFAESDYIGFFALKAGNGKSIEIDHLWLLPGEQHKGYRRMIFQYIFSYMRSNGYNKATLIAEPHAKGFYDKMGGKITGQFQSKISGRFLDIYEYELI